MTKKKSSASLVSKEIIIVPAEKTEETNQQINNKLNKENRKSRIAITEKKLAQLEEVHLIY